MFSTTKSYWHTFNIIRYQFDNIREVPSINQNVDSLRLSLLCDILPKTMSLRPFPFVSWCALNFPLTGLNSSSWPTSAFKSLIATLTSWLGKSSCSLESCAKKCLCYHRRLLDVGSARQCCWHWRNSLWFSKLTLFAADWSGIFEFRPLQEKRTVISSVTSTA